MANTTSPEESSPAQGAVAPSEPDLETNVEPDSAAKPEPSEACCEREDEEEEEQTAPGQENARGQSVEPEWVEERFRINRKKLETMLYGDSFSLSSLFRPSQVMKETDTQVKWPSKLKIGAKSKKDPHVKVEGKKANVLQAKKKILEVLETRVNKVTLKMDVAYTEHSHVIGKGGGNIKKVMEVTSCHIHFPDSNRHNAAGEKSNQVSIAGPIEGVEDARRRIRDLQPLTLTFDLPVSLAPQPLPDANSPLIQQVVQTLGVSVSFRTVPPQPQAQPAFFGSCCTVWGLQGNTPAVKKATCVLMELLVGSEVTGSVVTSQLDVTSQQHLFLLGQNGAHFLSVMHHTQTQIILPDLSAPQNLPSLVIQGSPDGVCLARQQLMDCLPVCLMFDMREDVEADPCALAQMMQNLGVFISVKPKVKQTNKSVVVKGLERNIQCLYEARRLLLGLDSYDSTKVTNVAPDPILAGNELTSYWLNMLLQQLRLSEHGELTHDVQSGTKARPSPPPGLPSPTDEVRAGLKGTDSRPLEKVFNNFHRWKKRTNKFEGSFSVFKMAFLFRSSKMMTSLFNQAVFTTTKDIASYLYFYSRKSALELSLCCLLPAMQRKPVVTEVRTPTDTWSGLGFSKSMPAEAVKELRNISRRSYKPYLSTKTEMTNPVSPSQSFSSRASTCSQRSPSSQIMDDLPELLSQLGLMKYIDVLEQQEIDYQTFLTLSDDDLKEVGVSTFGARRKMLLAISELNKSKRRPSDTSSVKSGYLEGGASGRLPRIADMEVAALSNRW
uniref:Bicaudal C homolog 2 n=1 Tax=Hippocampus comes TaxID=109280 RepID=A0A3Q2Y2R9_HIPCM